MAGENTAPEVPALLAGEVCEHSIDCRGKLDSGETITGTPTVAEQTTSDLTVTGITVNVAVVTIKGKSVPIGQAVQFKISGQLVAHSPYTLLVTFGTSAGQTRKGLFGFTVGTS